MHQITCGHCGKAHGSVAAVKACSQGTLFSCHWMVERMVDFDPEHGGEWWPQIVDCGAEATATERGWTCAAGHEHVNTQTRRDEGWEYAEDAGEAMNLIRAGVEPRTMDGHLATSPADFAPAFAMAGAR